MKNTIKVIFAIAVLTLMFIKVYGPLMTDKGNEKSDTIIHSYISNEKTLCQQAHR